MKQLEMLVPNFSGTNAPESVKRLKRTLFSCCFCNARRLRIASSGRTRLRGPIVVEDVDGREVTLAPGPKKGRERSTPGTEGNGLLAGAMVHPAHLEGASAPVGMGGGKHLWTGPLQTSLWSETSTTGRSAALCSLAALFSWRDSGELTSNVPLILASNVELFCQLKDTKSQFSHFGVKATVIITAHYGSDIKMVQVKVFFSCW